MTRREARLVVGRSDRLVTELRRLKKKHGVWPSKGMMRQFTRSGETPWGVKVYANTFGTWRRAKEEAGAPVCDYSEASLVAELRRLRDAELPDKPAGEAPRYRHIRSGHCRFSETAFNNTLGTGITAWLRAAGIPYSPPRDPKPGDTVLEAYRTLHARLRRLPLSSDLEREGIDVSAIYRHHGGLPQLRRRLGLPERAQKGELVGADGVIYESAGELGVGDRLFVALLDGHISDYEPHYSPPEWTSRAWTIDFLVTRRDGTTVFVEYDGYGPGRPRQDYRTHPKLEATVALGAPLWIVSDFGYAPAAGERISGPELSRRLTRSRARQAPRVESLPTGVGGSVDLATLATSLNLARERLAFLERRGIIERDADGHFDIARVRETLRVLYLSDQTELVSLPTLARLSGVDRDALRGAVRDGVVVADESRPSGKTTMRFRRSRARTIRAELGETLASTDGLVDVEAFSVRARVTSSHVHHLVQSGELEPAGYRLVGRTPRPWFRPAQARNVARKYGHHPDPEVHSWLTVKEVAEAVPCDPKTVFRHRANLRHVKSRRPTDSGPRIYLLDPEAIAVLRDLLRIGEPPPSCGTGEERGLLSPTEFAHELGVNVQRVWGWIRKRKLIAVHVERGHSGWKSYLSMNQVEEVRALLDSRGVWRGQGCVESP